MPNYGLVNWGGTGNIFAPFGQSGPQYNMRLATGAGIGVGGGQDIWYQGLEEPYTLLRQGENKAYPGINYAGGSRIPTINPVTGLYVDPVTGAPYTGTNLATGYSYNKGVPTGQVVPFSGGKVINPNDPNQRYQAANIIKSPEIASATQNLMDTFTKTASTALEDFNTYLGNFKDQIGGAAAKSAAATDIGPLSATLRGQQASYANALNQSAAEYAALNQATAGREGAVVQEARDLIPAYDQAMNDLRDYQSGTLQSAINARYAAGATPRSMGSGLARELIRGEAAITVPLEQAKIQQRYNVLGQFAMPSVLDIANRETARIGTFNPMIAAQQFQSGQATEQTIQQLAMATANMSYDNAVKYMTALSVPWNVQQQILSGQIAQLGGLSQLYSGSRYQGLQDVLGAYPTPAVGYNLGLPGYPGATRYGSPQYPSFGGPASSFVSGNLTAGNAPKRVNAISGNPMEYDPLMGMYIDLRTMEYNPDYQPPDWDYLSQMSRAKAGAQSNSYYDPASGLTIDRRTGLATGGNAAALAEYRAGYSGAERSGDSWSNSTYTPRASFTPPSSDMTYPFYYGNQLITNPMWNPENM